MRGIHADKLAIVVLALIVVIVVIALMVPKKLDRSGEATTAITNPLQTSADPTIQAETDPVNTATPEPVSPDLTVSDNGPQLHDDDSVFDVVITSPENGAQLTSDRCVVNGKVKNIRDGEKVRLFVCDDYGTIWPQKFAIIINGEFQSVVHIGEANDIVSGGQFVIFAKLPDDRTSQLVKVRRIR